MSVKPRDTGTAFSVGVADAGVDVAVAIVVGVRDDTADWPVTSKAEGKIASRVGTVGVVSVKPRDTGTASSVGVADAAVGFADAAVGFADAAVDVAVAVAVGVPDDTADWPVTSNRLLIG